MELPSSDSNGFKKCICITRLYLKKLLLQLASSRHSTDSSLANVSLAVHFGSCSPCDACWEPWSEPASGNGRGRTYHAAGFRTRRGPVGLGEGSVEVGSASVSPEERRRRWRRERAGPGAARVVVEEPGVGKRRRPGPVPEPGQPLQLLPD